MKAYYDSSEGIAWGAISLEEIKDVLQKEPRKIERSHSDMGKYTWQKIPEDSKSVKRSSSFLSNLDDTLREMEMVLKYGLDYVMPEDEVAEKEMMKSPEKDDTFKKPLKSKTKYSKTPKNKFDYVVSPVGLYIKGGRCSEDNKENICGRFLKVGSLKGKPKS